MIANRRTGIGPNAVSQQRTRLTTIMRIQKSRLILGVLIVLVVGCAVHPEVNYWNASTSANKRTDDWVTFKITDTAIVIAAKSKAQTTTSHANTGDNATDGNKGNAASNNALASKNSKNSKRTRNSPNNSASASGSQGNNAGAGNQNGKSDSGSQSPQTPSHINAAGSGPRPKATSLWLAPW